jgi:hypothetical protein
VKHAGVFFPLPRELTAEEVKAILMADTLVRDGQVTAQGERTTVPLARQRARLLLEAFPSGRIPLWGPSEPFAIRIAGHEMPLGPVWVHSACAQFDVEALRRHLVQPTNAADQLVELGVVVHAADGPVIRLAA